MQTFVRVVDGGSLSAAAKARRLSLAAVSRQISALESDLGATLIVRSTRRLQVTPSGLRWYDHCARILRDLEDARASVGESDEPRGVVVISAPMTIGLSHVVPCLEKVASKHPHLEIDLRLEDNVVDLVGDGIDVAVRGGIAPPDSPFIVAVPVMRFRRLAVASPAYLKRRGTPRHPRDLARHEALGHGPAGAPLRWIFSRANDEVVEVSPRCRLRSTAPIVLRDWARDGAGIALLPEWLVPTTDTSLVRLFDGWRSPEVEAWALHRVEHAHSKTPRIRAVVSALRRNLFERRG